MRKLMATLNAVRRLTGWPTALAVWALLSTGGALGAGDVAPPPPPPPPPASGELPPLPPHAEPVAARPPAAGEQEGPYYSAAAGRAGLLFAVSRTLDGEPLDRQAGEIRFEYARDWHRGDGGLGHWLGARGAWRYREIAVLGGFDERWFGAAAANRVQALHLLYGGVVDQGHAQPYSEGGFGLCVWWPPAGGRSHVAPEAGFRAVLWRLPRYRAAVSAFRQGLAQDNGAVFVQCEVYGSGGWNFRHKEGWIYDGGGRFTVTVAQLQLSLGYHLYGLGRSFAQGPAGSLALQF